MVNRPQTPKSKPCCHDLGVSQNYRHLFGGPQNKGYSISGSILGFPYLGVFRETTIERLMLLEEGAVEKTVL